MPYAENTAVSVEKSRLELERTLQRYGAGSFGYLSEPDSATVMFIMGDRRIKFTVPLTPINHFQLTPNGRPRTASSQHEAWEQAGRQKWRALNLVVKAKLEAIEAGISSFDEEFLAFVMLSDGSTVGDRITPGLNEAVMIGGQLPSLLALGR